MTVVVDASAVVEFVRATPTGERVHARLRGEDLHVPHTCPVEAASALRGLVRGNEMTAARAERALGDVANFAAEHHPAEPLLPAIWRLRHNLTAYDAFYVALAQALDAILVTVDGKFDTRPVRRLINVEVIT